MRIAAVICWYDESPLWLSRCVRSLAGVADVIIAADGAWAGFPHDNPISPPEQRTALLAAAEDCGLSVIELPARAWSSQAEKRTALYRSAWRVADHTLVIDADEELRCDDPQRVREVIEESKADAINMRVQTPIGRGASGGGGSATAPSGTRWQPRILRASGTITVGPRSHRTLSTAGRVIHCESVDDARDLIGRETAIVRSMSAAMIVNHTHSRDDDRLDAKSAYGCERSDRGFD